jgi:predicted O-methyltransferase YrrM
MKDALSHVIAVCARTALDRSTTARVAVVNHILSREPQLAIEPLTRRSVKPTRFASESVPGRIDGFEDVSFLFESSQLNHRVALLTFDEGALLWRLAANLENPVIAEIGRFKGGSTFLLAAAGGLGCRVYSYDAHIPLFDWPSGQELDDDVAAGLTRAGLADRVELIVADSKTAQPPSAPCDLVFIDGDHSYAGARGDYEHWRKVIAPGGHLLMHDAVPAGSFGIHRQEVERLVTEIEANDATWFKRVGTAGSIAHFVRTDAPAPWSS